MSKAIQVLLVENSEDDAALVMRVLQREGLDVRYERVASASAMQAALKHQSWDVVISDFSMPGFSGLAALKVVRATWPDIPFILISGTTGEEIAVDAMKAGANDYIVKNNISRLPSVVIRELRGAASRAEHRRARHELERFRMAMDVSPDSIDLTDPATMRFAYLNSAACRRLGRSREELLQLGPQNVSEIGDEQIRREFDEVIAAGERGTSQEQSYIRGDRSEGWTELHRRALRTDGGTLVVTIARDISARKEAELKLQLLNAELERRVAERTAQLEAANQDLEAFSYSVSHDLHAPLRAVNGFTRILEGRLSGMLDEESQRLLDRIKAGGARMGDLIDSLLKFARSTRAELKLTEVDLHEIFVSVVAEAHLASPQADVSIGMLPSVRGDAVLLREVVANLIDNAFKYSSKTLRPRIEVGYLPDEQGGAFFVRDNGVGFEPKYAENLFGPFRRLHSEGEFPGTGIGLALCKRILDRHGGRIWAEAALGAGASFFFTMPTGYAAPLSAPPTKVSLSEDIRAKANQAPQRRRNGICR